MITTKLIAKSCVILILSLAFVGCSPDKNETTVAQNQPSVSTKSKAGKTDLWVYLYQRQGSLF